MPNLKTFFINRFNSSSRSLNQKSIMAAFWGMVFNSMSLIFIFAPRTEDMGAMEMPRPASTRRNTPMDYTMCHFWFEAKGLANLYYRFDVTNASGKLG